MNNFGTLYHYEVKKILSRKLVWIVFLICVVCAGMFASADLTGKYYVDGEVVDTHYHMFQVDQEYKRALSGRMLDRQLLEEMSAAYGKVPAAVDRYTLTEEYQTYARPYSDIFNIVRAWTQQRGIDELKAWIPDEEALYTSRAESLGKVWQELRLSDAEKEFWREKEAQTDTPVMYLFHEGYSKLISNGMNTLGLLVLLFVCICMASVFTEEHTRRTDQLILSGAKGKSAVYWAKLAAGASVSAACAALLSVFVSVLVLVIYGAEGFQASLRISLYLWSSSCTMSLGQACLAAFGILILTAVFVGVLVLVLSEVLHSNIATLSVCTGAIIAGMVGRIPDQYRVFAQVWDWLPMRFLNAEYIFDVRMLPLFGHCFVSWKVVPVLYVLTGVLAAMAGKVVYRNYQVCGR
ncbi:MAG: hypothetical protein K2N95_13835 [Lachnospiraceae bacterium]|nr:hypothetical protein [Lachnospiraceae bacterium]